VQRLCPKNRNDLLRCLRQQTTLQHCTQGAVGMVQGVVLMRAIKKGRVAISKQWGISSLYCRGGRGGGLEYENMGGKWWSTAERRKGRGMYIQCLSTITNTSRFKVFSLDKCNTTPG